MNKVIDLTMDAAAGLCHLHSYFTEADLLTADSSTSMAHEDSELQRAIEASRVTAGLPPQESGITGTDVVYFGPANRSQYEPEKWDLVPIGKTSAQEILLDPEPAERKRDLNVPAFLKPSVDNHRLGALLTIYHEIPLLREVFLNRGVTQVNYGHDNEWWAGKAIEVPYISGSEPDEREELIYELQRLMAFLDKTDRSYGSTDALANLSTVKKWQRRRDMDIEAAVLNAWKSGIETRETGQVSKVFSIGVEGEDRGGQE